MTSAAAPPAKILLGPGGAVERIDGPGMGGGGAVTLSGWACDPEWPGAAVSVAVYAGAPREQTGSDIAGSGCTPISRWPCRSRARSAPPATVRRRDAARHGF